MRSIPVRPSVLLNLALLAVVVAVALAPTSAWALVTGSFSCSGGRAVGSLYDAGGGVCPNTMKFSNVFSFLVCHTEQLTANLMGNMYCAVIRALTPAVTAAVTLAVLFSGIGFTLGFSNVTGKDFLGLLLKIAVVYGFATQADLIIGIGYNLLVSGLREGTAVAIGSLYTAKGTAPPSNAMDVYALMDDFLAQALHFATDAVGQTWTSGQNPCKNAIFAVMAIFLIAFPPIFYIGVLMIIRISMTFVRAIFGYMYSIIGITFLLTLSPFFLSFYLFKQTHSLFDKWLGYLVSFSLQLVIVFAFLAFILSIRIDHITGSLMDVIMPAAQTKEGTSWRAPWKYCTLCEFDVVDKMTGAVMANNSPDFLSRGKLQCRMPKKPIPIDQMFAPPAKPAGGGAAAAPAPSASTAAFQNTLMAFATTGLLSLLVLVYVIDAVLGNIPALAQALANGLNSGTATSPQLVGGLTYGQAQALGVPGEGLLTTFERGFTAGYNSQTNTPAAIIAGFKEASKRLVVGSSGPQGVTDPGLVGQFMRFLVNPQRGPLSPHNPE